MRLRARFVSWLLYRANARMGQSYNHDRAYALKDRLLKRYGRWVGEDVQRIVHECWGEYEQGCRGATCWRCRGTGIYRTRWTLLERWEIAGRIFHRPIGPAVPRAVDFIDGRIRHSVDARDGEEALLWLALLFDPGLFWAQVTRSGQFSHPGPHPLIWLQWLAYGIRTRINRVTRRCYSCERRFLRAFNRDIRCRPCQAARAARAAVADEDLPF